MYCTIALATALLIPAAPAPKNAPADQGPAAGVAPRLVELKPDMDGKLRVQVTKSGNIQGNVTITIAAGPNAAPGVQNLIVQGGPSTTEQVELANLKELTITTAGGKSVTREEAMKALAKGGVVVISNDGKKVPSAFLKAFKDDVLVLVSPELVNQGGITKEGIGVMQVVPPARPPAPQPAPAPPK
jgi:hypothetical protein